MPLRSADLILPRLVSSRFLAVPARAQDGAALYKEHCASCHSPATDRAPGRDVLRAMTPQRILEALEFGSMVSMTHGRTTAERRALAEFASGKSLGAAFSIAAARVGDVHRLGAERRSDERRRTVERLRPERVEHAIPAGVPPRESRPRTSRV